MIPFADRLKKPLVVSGGRDRLWPVLQFLGEQSCGGATDLFASVKEFMSSFPTRGIAILISDFFDEQGCERAVEMLRSAGHDFVLLQVHSAEEQHPTAAGELILEDAETGAQRTVECSPQSTALYERRFQEFSARLAAPRDSQRRKIRARGDEYRLPGIRSAKPAQRAGAGMNWLALSPVEIAAGVGGARRAGAVALPAPPAPAAPQSFHAAFLGQRAADFAAAPPEASRAVGIPGADSFFAAARSGAGESALGHRV